jgi:type II secretory pathway component PulK
MKTEKTNRNPTSALRAIPPALRDMRPRSRRGFVLVLVLVVVAMLMLVCFTFSELMFSHRKAAVVTGRQEQTMMAAQSAVEKARIFLYKSQDLQSQNGGWYDNASMFSGIIVVNDANPAACVKVAMIAPLIENGLYSNGIRYGLENESAKLNINNILNFTKSSTGSGSTTGSTSGSTTGSTSSTGTTSSAGSTSATGSTSTTGSTSATSTGSTSTTGSTSDSTTSSTSSEPRDILMNLPGMTQEIADSILDWIDTNEQVRDSGAEADYYANLQPPYKPANGPLTTIDELLLVKGVVPAMLFGGDLNRNGRLDANESNNLNVSGIDNSTGEMNTGWAPYLTLYSKENNTQASDGTTKIDLNGSDLEQLYSDLQTVLSAEQAAFICAYRLYGPYTSTSSSGSSGTSGTSSSTAKTSTSSITSGALDLTQSGSNNISSFLDLVGAKVSLSASSSSGQSGSSSSSSSSSQQATIYASPFTENSGDMKSYLPLLQDYTTVSSSAIVGRININQAPRAVLMCIPGITSEIVDEIIARRPMDTINADKTFKFATWLLSEDIVDLEQMKSLEKYITCGGDVYRIQAIGYFDDGGVSARIEVILDASTQPATVLFWRDMSHLGRGFTLQELGSQTTTQTAQ